MDSLPYNVIWTMDSDAVTVSKQVFERREVQFAQSVKNNFRFQFQSSFAVAMDAYVYYDSLDFPFLSARTSNKTLTKYAILLNEPTVVRCEEEKEEVCKLASELLPELSVNDSEEDLVKNLGEVLKAKILAHADVDKVPIFKADDIIKNNGKSLVPILYRIATENFGQTDKSVFKIIECRNVTKLISEWKPSLPDRLITFGHQVVVVQLETSFVPYNDFAYAVLRQLDCEWKVKLPRSFFFPDDVCKVKATLNRDLCVVSPSMPDGDLDVNKKMGQLKYEVLMMIKQSCISAMKNYLVKRDLRVGKFSDTLDGVSALRHLYRQLQDRLRQPGDAFELQSDTMRELKKLVRQMRGGTEALTSHTWIDYGKKVGLSIPLSASSSATSISVASSIVESDEDDHNNNQILPGALHDDDEDDETLKSTFTFPSFSLADMTSVADNKKDATVTSFPVNDIPEDNKRSAEHEQVIAFALQHDTMTESEDENSLLVLETPDIRDINSSVSDASATATEKQSKKNNETSRKSQGKGKGFVLEAFTEFREWVDKKMQKRKKNGGVEGAEEDEDKDEQEGFSVHEFSANSILQILQLPKQARQEIESIHK